MANDDSTTSTLRSTVSVRHHQDHGTPVEYSRAELSTSGSRRHGSISVVDLSPFYSAFKLISQELFVAQLIRAHPILVFNSCHWAFPQSGTYFRATASKEGRPRAHICYRRM